MLKIYHSNDLDVLCGMLQAIMKQQPPSLFEREAILVQSQGMAHWLKLNIAEGLGVAAQIDFPLPFSFVWQVFNQLRPDLPQRSHFDKPYMSWQLMRLLPELVAGAAADSQHPCAAIAHYLDDDPQGIKCFQLAETIADVFDQYLVYRPDWLINWEANIDTIDDADVTLQPWQPVVWRALVEDAKSLGHCLDHRARLMDQLAELVSRYPQRLQQLPKRLFVFGIAALPGSYWQVLNAISSEIEVHFFLLNPCRNFWGDIVDDRRRAWILQRQPEAATYLERGNPLLASWGRLGRDFLTLVHDTELASDIEAWVEPEQTTLLQQLQSDILELNDRQQQAFTPAALQHSQFKTAVDPADDSIRIISAHSPLREVQRLHDQLLYWFDQEPQLQPRDVVVMVPDIDSYAPYIDAVFGSAEQASQDRGLRIPWAIADQSIMVENPLIETFLALLGLADSRLTVADVQDWLDVAAIRCRFGIASDELDTIKDWLSRANIRWGMHGQQRQQLGLPAFEQNSWRKGLRQLLLGLMIPVEIPGSDMQPGWSGDWPVAAVEGSSAELLGKLLQLVDCLERWQQLLRQNHAPAQWLSLISGLLDALFSTEFGRADAIGALEQQRQQSSLQRIRDTLLSWQEELQRGGALQDQQLTFSARVVRSWFTNQLGQQGGWQRFLAGPVNFCTLMPMRSIPFKVVCLLGMNDVDYPRKVPPVGFDLMVTGKRRRGDRSRRDDDRYLFLEAVSSAQRKLYISYRGRGVRENNEQQPSVLISELMDYLCDGFCLPQLADLPHGDSRRQMRQWLLEELPLQPFGAGVFRASHLPRAIPGYQQLWAAVAGQAAGASDKHNNRFLAAPLALPDELLGIDGQVPVVELADLQRALKNSCQFFLQRRLRVSLQPQWQDNPTEEPFSLDNLQQYLVRDEEITLALAAAAAPSATLDDSDLRRQRLQSLGELPVQALGKLVLESARQGSQALIERLQQLALQTAEPELMQTRLVLAADSAAEQVFDLQGELGPQLDGTLIYWRAGAVRSSHLLASWLDLLLARLVYGERIQAALYLGLDRKSGKLQVHHLQAPTTEQAQDWLTRALGYYLANWQFPQTLLPELLWQLLQQEEDKHEGLVKAEQDSEFGQLGSIEVERCLPQLARQLEDDGWRESWISQHSWVFELLLRQYQYGDKEADQ